MIYFDLGNVLLKFDHELMVRQMAEVAGVPVEVVRAAAFEGGLQARYERGQMTTDEFYDAFCDATGTQPNFDALCHAASDIFTVNVPMLPVVTHLKATGHRLGILSNTCQCHWEHCLARFGFLSGTFDPCALSYELQAAKPAPDIFRKAAELAGVAPEEVFYCDDMPGHVEGAKQAGFDAVQFTSARELVSELWRRGVEFGY